MDGVHRVHELKARGGGIADLGGGWIMRLGERLVLIA
jgi:hypothetical protein